jgi:hypothetical protein
MRADDRALVEHRVLRAHQELDLTHPWRPCFLLALLAPHLTGTRE